MKTKITWFLIGFVTCSFLWVNALGKNKGYEDQQKILKGLVCQMPKEQLKALIVNVELPSDVKLGDNAIKVKQAYRNNIYNECYGV